MTGIPAALCVLLIGTQAMQAPAPSDAGRPHARFALGAGVGTLGLGMAGTAPLAERLNVRLGLHALNLSGTFSRNDIDYRANLRMRSAAACVDFHPFAGPFRLTAGLVWLDDAIRAGATPLKNVQIGGLVFTPEQTGTIRADLDYPSAGWYAGLGFGNPFAERGRISGSVDLGAVWHARPDFRMTADGRFAGLAPFQAELAREQRDIERDVIRRLRYWPVVQFGLSIRF